MAGALPGWRDVAAHTVIAPQMGARFVQIEAVLTESSHIAWPSSLLERVVFVHEGGPKICTENSNDSLAAFSFAYLPPHTAFELSSEAPGRITIFEKVYQALPGIDAPVYRSGSALGVEGKPFLGDPDAVLQTLLPESEEWDLAVNIFTFQPGAQLPLIEVHVMEHGLRMLQGSGIYRLGDDWHPVQTGDVIWMASYCPQWFGALGKTPAAYLYYKDVNRDSLP